jgi:hypothetical protein
MHTKQMIDHPSHKALTGKIRKAIEALQAGRVAFLDPTVIAADLLSLVWCYSNDFTMVGHYNVTSESSSSHYDCKGYTVTLH